MTGLIYSMPNTKENIRFLNEYGKPYGGERDVKLYTIRQDAVAAGDLLAGVFR